MSLGRSDKIDDVVKALVAAHAEMDNPHKDADNSHFKTRYASLPGVLDTVRPVLARHGLAVLQVPGSGEAGPVIHTTVLHASGQWLELPPLEVPASKRDPQGYGSAITYGRRYALLSACGVAAEDDDGNAASRPAPRVQAARGAPRIGPAQVKVLEATIQKVGANRVGFLHYLGVGDLAELPASRFAEALELLDRKRLANERLKAPPADEEGDPFAAEEGEVEVG